MHGSMINDSTDIYCCLMYRYNFSTENINISSEAVIKMCYVSESFSMESMLNSFNKKIINKFWISG